METQDSINQWAIATFGDGGTTFGALCRARAEMGELMREVGAGRNANIPAEAADVVIVLMRAAARVGTNLDAFVERHMKYPLEDVSQYATAADMALCRALRSHTESRDCGASLIECVWQLRELCAAVGAELREAIDAKMAVNRERAWKRDGDTGQGYHVEKPKPLSSPARYRLADALNRAGIASHNNCGVGQHSIVVGERLVEACAAFDIAIVDLKP